MRVVVMQPGKAPEVKELPWTAGLVELQEIVGGYIEALPLRAALPPGTVVYCDEEGKHKGLPGSFSIPGDFVCGSVVATGVDSDGETRSLTDAEAAAICRLLTTLRSFGGAP